MKITTGRLNPDLSCSMFVVLVGRTKPDAFEIGKQIADAVTQLNPKPVKLKFEKVLFFLSQSSCLVCYFQCFCVGLLSLCFTN